MTAHQLIRTPYSMVAIAATATAVFFASCGGADKSPAPSAPAKPAAETPAPTTEATSAAPAYPADFITAADITLGPIDQARVDAGKKIFDEKCHVCHGLSDQKVVGPGWKGVTQDRKPEWIMNMILHTQWMIENDPDAQALVEETKTVMPDQGLTKDQARDMLELMRTL